MGKLSTSSCKGLWKGGFGIMMRKVDEKKILWSEKGVKQGHFVVIATQFCIELEYLDHPEFVKLLKQAEEEFGFSQVGALEIPCEPDELKKIIGRKKQHINKGITITC
jgi:SAUR family protein